MSHLRWSKRPSKLDGRRVVDHHPCRVARRRADARTRRPVAQFQSMNDWILLPEHIRAFLLRGERHIKYFGAARLLLWGDDQSTSDSSSSLCRAVLLVLPGVGCPMSIVQNFLPIPKSIHN